MKAVDTSVLLLAAQRTHPLHERALGLLATLAEGRAPWALPWPCVYEFLRVATHPRVFLPPLSLDRARADLSSLLASPSLVLLSGAENHAEWLDTLLSGASVCGNLALSMQVAALCLEHGVDEIFSTDVDLARYAGLRVTNPFV